MQEQVAETPSILVVDDNPLIINVLKSLLSSENFQVFSCSNGAEALDLLGNKCVDVIVCDVMMPSMDGFELHEVVRQKPELSHIPFVFLTALSEDYEVNRGREMGADDYLVKPFDPRQLLSVVKGKVVRSRSLKNISEERYDSYRKKVIHTLSHEFRTPLVAINTGTELLLEQKDFDKDRASHLLEAIQRGGMRLEKLVNDFMLLQQIEAGVAVRLFEQRAKEMDVSDLVRRSVEHCQEFLRKDNFEVRLIDRAQGRRVKVYEPQLFDVFERLFSNAVKFRASENLIEVVIYPQSDDVVIEVRDRGIGMDVEKVKEAIDVFGQIDRDKLEQQGGGLGLAIANRYVVISGGRLEFENREGGGSVVSVILPLANPS